MLKCKHLEETRMTYVQHSIRSMKFALWSLKMYFVCLAHAAFPCFFTDTFSENVLRLARAIEEEQDAKH